MIEYPDEYELDIVLRDGEVVHVRPIKPDDGPRLVDFFERLGPQSRYFRFFRVKKTLDPEEVEYFTHVDYDRRMALVVLKGGRIIGVGRYDRLEDEPEVAEVAFAVVDDEQGRGIGTELLQLLTAYARSRGITAFRAYVLPENVQMMRVFRNSGYSLSRTLEHGVYTVHFPVAYTEDARRAAEEREKRAVAASLLPLFFPRTVAVIGASTEPGSIGNNLFRNILTGGYGGTLYPVNPNTGVVNAVRAYPSVKDIPDDVDLAFVVVPAPVVAQVVRECAEKGVRGLVVISAGFGESGPEGEAREEELVRLVREAGMRMVGPNCMGLINTAPAVCLNGTFAPIAPPPGNIAMSSQSGALGIAILDHCRRHRLGISQFVSVGNKADVSGNDLLLAWEDDPATDVILLYLESFGNPRRFGRIARRVARTKPIAAVKSGRTHAGTRAASSHTGALASADIAVDALFRQSGVIRVDTLSELFAVGSLLANQPIPKGRRVGVVTNAGGPAILAADALESHRLELPEFSTDLQKAILAEVPGAAARNPVDLIAGAGPEEYRKVLPRLFASGEIDSLMVVYVPTDPSGVGEVGEVVRDVAGSHGEGITTLAVFMQAEEAASHLAGDRVTVPTFAFPEDAARALARVVEYSEWLRRDPGTVPVFDDVDVAQAEEVVAAALRRLGEEGGWLTPSETDRLLSAFRIPVAVSIVVTSAKEAAEAQRKLGRPVAVKVVSEEAVHKSDVGGVVLNVASPEAAADAYRRVTSVVEGETRALVQEMVGGGHEVLVGVAEDPTFGPLVVFGLGGVYVELLGDISFRLHPLTDVDAEEMISGIKGARLLEGYRGQPPGDRRALRDLLLRVSALVSAIPEISEMDLNPVKVLPEGVVVVDARIRVRPVPEGWSPELVDLPGVAGDRL
jgi:acetyl coenzyme A synthetase (ADP forming)-like protein